MLNLPVVFYAVIVSSFLTAMVGLVRFRGIDIGAKALAILCVVNYCEGSAAFLLSMMKIRNLELLNDYRPVELLLTACVFYLMVESRFAKKLLVVSSSVFVLVWIADKIYLDDPAQLNNRMALLSRVIAVV